jgi:hypothetical protein
MTMNESDAKGTALATRLAREFSRHLPSAVASFPAAIEHLRPDSFLTGSSVAVQLAAEHHACPWRIQRLVSRYHGFSIRLAAWSWRFRLLKISIDEQVDVGKPRKCVEKPTSMASPYLCQIPLLIQNMHASSAIAKAG